jgi:SNF2 family DNA or RNA helicase
MSQPKLHPLWNGFTYFSHQLQGIQWMLNLEKEGVDEGESKIYGGLQCDDMGLGKTIQVASVIANHKKKMTLLVAPLAMVETWATTCMKCGFLVYEINQKTGEWDCMNKNSPMPTHFIRLRPSVYITNYDKIPNRPSMFAYAWDRVVLDEAHKIRNPNGQLAMALRMVRAPIRWAVTGTPLVNSMRDIVSLLAFIGVPVNATFSWEKRFQTMLPKILLHRSLDSLRSIIQGAPPVPEITQCILPFTTPEEEEFYHGVQGSISHLMDKYNGDVMNNAQKFLLLLRLRQISVHPQVYLNAKRRENTNYHRNNWVNPSTKMSKVREIINADQDASSDVHKYIVFCQFHEEMEIFRDFLVDENLIEEDNVLLYHGGMNQAERTKVLAYSKETPKTTVLLLQLQSGGVGLNLQEYDRVIFMSPWWTAALMDQAIARAVRMGQTKVVRVFHLHLAAEKENSINIDHMVNEKAEEKRRMLEKVFSWCP